MSVKRIQVNPEMLVWARQKAGYGLDEAAHKLGFRDSSVATAVSKLERLESGEQDPTLSQAAKLAEIYRRPKALFFLRAAPVEDEPLTDYRRFPDMQVTPIQQGWLDSVQRLMLNRVDVLSEVLESEDGFRPPSLPFSSQLEEGEDAVAKRIATALDFNPLNRRDRGRNSAEFFKGLRERAERNAGVFTFLVSRYGMGQPELPPSIYRGFAIANRIAPAIIINGLDSDTAKVFSVFHELAHIALGDSAISGGMWSFQNGGTETFCNRVAAMLLLPVEVVDNERYESEEDVREIAAKWLVSPQMTAYRLHNLHRISAELRDAIVHQAFEEHPRFERTSEDSGGPSAHTQWKSWIGRAAIGVIGAAVEDGRLTHTAAARAFGIRPTSLSTFLKASKDSRGVY